MTCQQPVLWITAFLGFALSVQGYPTHYCPRGLVAYEEKCYKMLHVATTWPEAKILCETMGAHLVEINDPMKESFLFYRVLNFEPDKARSALWIGASDMMSENDWVWMTSRRHMTYRNWKLRQSTAFADNHGHCLAMQTLPEFAWLQVDCSERLGFVCEFDEPY
ncbi:perlucin-like protein [Aplysia californica]|uniref:Perlucin-like protein n=1 Tax=Aplysia californica TaxID=6500 RepID=A0ABM0ZZD2_APLCA|nr:perlucin-like protein [Aplysia californica]